SRPLAPHLPADAGRMMTERTAQPVGWRQMWRSETLFESRTGKPCGRRARPPRGSPRTTAAVDERPLWGDCSACPVRATRTLAPATCSPSVEWPRCVRRRLARVTTHHGVACEIPTTGGASVVVWVSGRSATRIVEPDRQMKGDHPSLAPAAPVPVIL